MSNQSKFNQEVNNLKNKAALTYNPKSFLFIREMIEENKGMITLATDKNPKIILNLVMSIIEYAECKAQRIDEDDKSFSRIERD